LSVTTIDYTVTADLFKDIDPIGLLRETSAREFQVELRQRLREEFPKANIFLKWNPNRTGAADVFTLPETETEQVRVKAIADQVWSNRDAWCKYDDAVIASL